MLQNNALEGPNGEIQNDRVDRLFNLVVANEPENTIAAPVKIVGLGLHTGEWTSLSILPAAPGTGIRFAHSTLAPVAVDGQVSYCDDNTTSVSVGATRLLCVEHLMAALHGLRIANCELWFEGGTEVPFVDGSAKPICDLLLAAGIEQQRPTVTRLRANAQFRFVFPTGGSVVIEPCSKLRVNASIEFPNPIGQQQELIDITPVNFIDKIAAARTFIRDPICKISYSQARNIRLKGLPEVPDENGLIIYDSREFLYPLRHKRECVRHKILDFLGDIYTCGMEIEAEFTLVRPGHASNLKIANAIRAFLHDSL